MREKPLSWIRRGNHFVDVEKLTILPEGAGMHMPMRSSVLAAMSTTKPLSLAQIAERIEGAIGERPRSQTVYRHIRLLQKRQGVNIRRVRGPKSGYVIDIT